VPSCSSAYTSPSPTCDAYVHTDTLVWCKRCFKARAGMAWCRDAAARLSSCPRLPLSGHGGAPACFTFETSGIWDGFSAHGAVSRRQRATMLLVRRLLLRSRHWRGVTLADLQDVVSLRLAVRGGSGRTFGGAAHSGRWTAAISTDCQIARPAAPSRTSLPHGGVRRSGIPHGILAGWAGPCRLAVRVTQFNGIAGCQRC